MVFHLPKDKRKVAILAGLIGNIIEWYDFALYGYMAAIISYLFFPNDVPALALLSTYGIFAVGFVMRPIGSAVFGWLGDTIGRSKTMIISVTAMMIPTFVLGLLPTFDSIGMMAPVLLVVLRLIQGLSVGGEFSTSVTYLVETSPENQRGFSGSWGNVGSGMGMLLGSLMAAAVTNLLGDNALNSWGWRIPFLFGGVIGVTAIILRRYLPNSKYFVEHAKKKEDSSPIREAFVKNTREVVQGMLFASGYGVIFYLIMVYLPTWLNQYASFPLDTALKINTVATAILTILIPVMGWITDRFIRRTHFMLISMITILIVSIPAFLWLRGANTVIVIIVQITLAILVAMLSGVSPALFVELFPTRDRLSGYSISFNFGMGIFGGTTPMILTWLIEKTQISWIPAVYMVAWAGVCVFALFWMTDRSREPLQ